jgi:hypothetical protein
MGLEYRYEKYNFQYDMHPALNAMAAAGWHIHTAMPAYTELYILWERGDSARARSVTLHLEQAKQTEAREEEAGAEQAIEVTVPAEVSVPAAVTVPAEEELPEEQPEQVADDYSEPAVR